MTDTAIRALEPKPSSLMPSANEWDLMFRMAAQLVPTGFLPDSIKTPEQAVAIILKGRELNVPPMYALSNIAIVKGKPTVSAEMMLALVYRDHGKRAIRVKDSNDTACTVEYRLDGWSDVLSYTFTIDQAQKAGLTRNQTWTQYPAAMLRARCISAVARMAFPESIAGMYVPGELGEAVTITNDGEVISEVSTVPSAQAVVVNPDTGEIQDEAETDEQFRDRIIRRTHAVGKKRGWEHEHLSLLLKGKYGHGFTEASTGELEDLSTWLDDGNGNVDAKLGQIRDQLAKRESGVTAQAELINDPELNEAADRVQAAERARA